MNKSSVILEAKGLSHTFCDVGNRLIMVLDQMHFSLQSGEKIAILGSSGSGKSTLLQILAGLLSPTVGDVEWLKKSLMNMTEVERELQRNQQLGFIYQFHHLLAEFTALENVAMPLLIAGLSRQEAKVRAFEILKQLGLESRCDHKPAFLSGGERQRVAIARAMVNRPLCVLADEPTGNLDQATAEQVLEAMMAIFNHTQTALIMVTHDQDMVRYVDRAYRLVQGKLVLL